MCGVLQGCPLSAALFNFAIDPLLLVFSLLVVEPKIGEVRACADDLAAAVQNIQSLIMIHSIFDSFHRISGLRLNPDKCILILTCVNATPEAIARTRAWLRVHIPEWENIGIANHGKYLGIVLGPRANLHQWTEPLSKFKKSVSDINKANLPAALSVVNYNRKAATVLGYVAQVWPPPKHLKQLEVAAINKVLHFATNTMDHATMLSLNHSFGIKFIPLGPYLQANMMRAACKTLSNIHEQVQSLWLAAREHQSLNQVLSAPNPPGWDSLPIAYNLQNSKACSKLSSSLKHKIIRMREDIRKHRSWSLQSKVFLRKRIVTLCPGIPIDIQNASKHCIESFKQLHPSELVMCLRTLANAWTTSYRYHETPLLPCIFGCNIFRPVLKGVYYKDDLQHYLVCKQLWKLVDMVLGLKSTPSPAHRLCLLADHPPPLALVIDHSMYHGIKQGNSVKSRGKQSLLQIGPARV